MAVASETIKRIDSSRSMKKLHSRRDSDAISESSSLADPSDNCTSDHHPSSSLSQSQLDSQDQTTLRSEEYRQLFRLPPDEVLIQDFNCACQESFLMQGHMYLFVHYICFYSNLFGYETKKIIPFEEVTSVKRAKTAAIFPTAIEIIAAGKKYLFTSFLSRDEAFKLLSDGWLEHGNGNKAIMDQESRPELNRQESGIVILEPVKSSKQVEDELDITERNKDVSVSEDTEPQPNGEAETVLAPSVVNDNVEEKDAEAVQITDCSSSVKNLEGEVDVPDAPKVPDGYMLVAESKFPINVEKFFNIFFSDDAVNFLQSFHQKCGDKEFKCSSWQVHNEFGHARDVSFQHPIKIYFGAKFGSCREIQKYRFYGNSHLVIDTSQEITDVPYGDYFRVEGRWVVERDGDESKECCNLRVYTNVAFSKSTIWKGKIVTNTMDECKEAYAAWNELAHEFLLQKNLETEAANRAADVVKSAQTPPDLVAKTVDSSDKRSELRKTETLADTKDISHVSMPLRGTIGGGAASAASFLKDYVGKFHVLVKSQSQLPSLAVIIVALIFLLMQISIIVLLARPQHIQVIPQPDLRVGVTERGAEAIALVDKQISHLKEEMLVVEILLEKLQREHALLKVQLNDLTHLRNQHT